MCSASAGWAKQNVSDQKRPQDFGWGGNCPLAARDEENFENVLQNGAFWSISE